MLFSGRYQKQVVDGLIGVKVVQISAGYDHCACVTSTGLVYTWGSNIVGMLGTPLTILLLMIAYFIIACYFFRSLDTGAILMKITKVEKIDLSNRFRLYPCHLSKLKKKKNNDNVRI